MISHDFVKFSLLDKAFNESFFNFLPIVSELHSKFINQVIKGTAKNFKNIKLFSEEITLKVISGIYLDKIRYFYKKDCPLSVISYINILNKYGRIKSITERKFLQVF